MRGKKGKRVKVGGLLCAGVGMAVLIYVLYPIVSYEIASRRQFADFLSPVPMEEELIYEEKVKKGEVDFTRASNWFVGEVKTGDFKEAGIRYYTMSIASLGIKDATVAIGGEDLKESLIQYPGTALPGKRGNAVIFGHSILPQFFNPKDYLTLFSTLTEIKKGDKIMVEYDGISYEYRVEEIFEVRPTDVQILEQNTTDSFVTLVTCVPPGHPLRPKRLVVRARLTPYYKMGQ